MTRPWEKQKTQLRRLKQAVETAEQAPPDPLRVLYFTSKTCGPCKVFRPRLVGWAAKAGLMTKLETHDVDTIEGGSLADTYRVMSMPTVILVSGEATSRLQGCASEKDLDKLLKLVRVKAEKLAKLATGETP